MKKSAKSRKPAKAKKPKAKKLAKIKKVKKPKHKRRPRTLGAQFYAQSERLGFRLLEAADAGLYVALFTDAETVEYFGKPLSLERAKQSFAKALALSQQESWTQRISAVVESGSGDALGIASIKIVDPDKRIAEVGILLKPSAQAQRYATEASTALINSAFRRHTISGISARVSFGHKAGESLVNTLGYTRGEDIPPTGDTGGRSTWTLSRETWAKTYE